MGKMSELADAVSELKRCGEILIEVSETLSELFSSAEPNSQEPPKEKAATPEKQSEAKTATLEEVRAALAKKSRAGYTVEVRELLQRYGASRLSEVASVNYEALLQDAEVIGYAT